MSAGKFMRFIRVIVLFVFLSFFLSSCGFFSASYLIGKGVVTAPYKVTKFAVKTVYGTGKVVYKIGEYTFEVVMAPLSWPFTRDGLESIDGLSPREAVEQGRVKMAPYVVNGRRYVPMSLEEAAVYRETGIASWYGEETRRQKGGHMTANGEAFNPKGLNAAHRYLPLPTYVRVTNLENRRSVILRVNDRGPFVDGRIIDLSAGAAKRLGFFKNGLARVLVETIDVEG